jgi:DNA-binding transcriptional LysR family regulator
VRWTSGRAIPNYGGTGDVAANSGGYFRRADPPIDGPARNADRDSPMAMNWRVLDLNLLVAFDAVMQERSVKRAAARVGLSQPALSHALTRLRHMLKDDLFIRTPQGMVPTPRAEELALPVRHALDELQLSLESSDFDPATATRTFRITVDNYAALVLAGPIVTRAAELAPGVTLDIRPTGTVDVVDLIDKGEFDLAIGPHTEAGERFSVTCLLEDEFAVLLRRGHPAVENGALSLASLAALPHLEISSSGDDLSFIDRGLAEHGLSHRVALRAPYLSSAPILASSHMVAVVRRRAAQAFACAHALAMRNLPFPSPTIPTTMLWHRRFDAQPGHRWLRETVAAVGRELAQR